MTREPPIVFRCDATAEIALGHLKRCLSLAQAVRDRMGQCAFICYDDPAARTTMAEHSFPVTWSAAPVNRGSDLETTIASIKETRSRRVVIDSYDVDDAYFAALRGAGLHVTYFEDYQKTDWRVDAVINGVVGAESLPYSAPQALLGPEYLVLGPEYWDGPRPRAGAAEPLEIVITMGGIDHYDLTSRVIALLDNISRPLRIHAVIGPYYGNTDEISARARASRHETILHDRPSGLAAIIDNSDVGISAGGFTLYEFAALGVPALGIWLWPNQRQNAERLGDAGVIVCLKYDDGPDFDAELGAAVSSLIESPKKMDAMRGAGPAVVDGRGAGRVAEAIASFAMSD